MPGLFCVGLDWWNSLSREDQRVIGEAANLAVMYNNYIVKSTNEAYRHKCLDEGMEIYTPTDEERQLFVEKVQTVYDYFIEDGVSTQKLIELIYNS